MVTPLFDSNKSTRLLNKTSKYIIHLLYLLSHHYQYKALSVVLSRFWNAYNPIRADHPNNPEERWCIYSMYFKEQLKLRKINTTYFSEYNLFEITIGNEISLIYVIYHSPSQTASEFDDFLKNLKSFYISLINLCSDIWWL